MAAPNSGSHCILNTMVIQVQASASQRNAPKVPSLALCPAYWEVQYPNLVDERWEICTKFV